LVAFLEPNLYRQFYNISKEQSGNKSYNKWEEYDIILDKNVLDKIKLFTPINPGAYKNNKGFRLSKKGVDTGIFKKSEKEGENDIMRNNIENNIHDDMDGEIGGNIYQNNFSNNITGVIPGNIQKEQDN